MVDNVKPIMAGVDVPGVANAHTVKLLEHILERAKSGEISDVAIGAWTADGAAITCFTPNHSTQLLGALVRLSGRIERSMEGI